MKFRERLRDLRLRHHMSIKEVAQIIGVPAATYASYESRGSQPNFDVLIRIADVFTVSLDYLIAGGNVAPRSILAIAGFSVTCESDGTFTVANGVKSYIISKNAIMSVYEAIQVVQYGIIKEAAPRLLALVSRKE